MENSSNVKSGRMGWFPGRFEFSKDALRFRGLAPLSSELFVLGAPVPEYGFESSYISLSLYI